MNRDKFYTLYDIIAGNIDGPTRRNCTLPGTATLLIACRFFATSSFQIIIGDIFGVTKLAVSTAITSVTKTICKRINVFIKWPDNRSITTSSNLIMNRYSFPLVERIIDGTHIPIQRPEIYQKAYINRKQVHSNNVQVVCSGPDLLIIEICAKWHRSIHDSRMLSQSDLYSKFEASTRPIVNRNVILGDSGYALLPQLMTPIYERPTLTPSERRFNLCLKNVRSCVERCLGAWKEKFASVNKLRFNPGKCCQVITPPLAFTISYGMRVTSSCILTILNITTIMKLIKLMKVAYLKITAGIERRSKIIHDYY